MAREKSSGKTPARATLSIDEYFRGVRASEMPVVARALTLIESSRPDDQLLAEQLLTQLIPFTGGAIRLGITGSPGAGKSTFIEALGLHLTGDGHRVAVLAIDPSSDVTGGSILGDKTRMPQLAADPNAYIRPSPASGTLGGAAQRTRESMLLCEAAGYDVVIVETVGVGQSESHVVHMTDCFLTLVLPLAGDELQGIKRGLLEVVDFIVVNKADGEARNACEVAAQQYRSAIESLSGRSAEEVPQVFTCSALNDDGVDDVWQEVAQRHARLTATGTLAARRKQQNLHWLWAIVDGRIKQLIHSHPKVQSVRDDLEQQVLSGTLSAEAAARRILEASGLL